MEDNFFDKEEKTWMRKLEKLLANKPEKLRLYTTGGDICVCKIGISANDLCQNLADNIIESTVMITDAHDDTCNKNI